jgi:hypothetical protein
MVIMPYKLMESLKKHANKMNLKIARVKVGANYVLLSMIDV